MTEGQRAYAKARALKRSFKGVVAAAVTLAVAGGLAACGSDDSGDKGSTGTTTNAHADTKIAIVMPTLAPGYAQQIGCGAYLEGKRLGFDVGQPQGAPAATAAGDAAAQARILQAVFATSPDGLIFSAADATAGGVAIKPQVAQGLPVVSVDVALEDPSLAVSFISSSHEDGGKLGGELLAEQIGESGEVIAIGVVPSHPITIGRINGFKEAMKEFPDIDLDGVKYPEFDVNKIAAETSALLQAHPNLKGIYTTNDTVATGVATALRSAGLDGKIKVITWDLQPPGIKMLEDGVVTGAVVQKPREEGKIAMQQLANKLDGKPVEAEVTAPLTTVTDETIDDPASQALYYTADC